VTFGHHLCADQNTGFAGRHSAHDFFHITASADDVTIEARERYSREKSCQSLFDAFGALSDGLDRKSALRASRRQPRVEPAVMAAQSSRGKVHRQPGIALLTWSDPSASRAK
jgi:hypothetical protein